MCFQGKSDKTVGLKPQQIQFFFHMGYTGIKDLLHMVCYSSLSMVTQMNHFGWETGLLQWPSATCPSHLCSSMKHYYRASALCQLQLWVKQLGQAQAAIPMAAQSSVAFTFCYHGVFIFHMAKAWTDDHCCPAPISSLSHQDTRAAPRRTALVLNSLPIKSLSLFFLLTRAAFPVLLIVWKRNLLHNIKNTFSKQSGVERERKRW